MLNIVSNKLDSGNILLINLTGVLDSQTAHDFENFFEGLINDNHHYLIIEASGLEYISSSGIGALIQLIRKLGFVGGSCVFLQLNPEIRMLFNFFELSRELQYFLSQQEAENFLSERMQKQSHTLKSGEFLSYKDSGVESIYEEAEPIVTIDDTYLKLVAAQQIGETPISISREKRTIEQLTEIKEMGQVSSVKGGAVDVKDNKMFKSKIIHCEQCRSNIRVYNFGKHLCPVCHINFRVRKDGSPMFFEKL